ncbi:MAG: aldo/keto reductase [Candidatus Hodarchaeota archaeon]
MEYTTFGKTGLKVTRMGVGCGGPSRRSVSVPIIQYALDAGVNYIDTAESYNTEKIVGKAIAGRERENIVISTKKSLWGTHPTANDVRKSLEKSLKKLGTDYVDIYNFHAVGLREYDYVKSDLVPVFQELRDEGKIRFLGITEEFNTDPAHEMLERALEDDCWDVMMVGFNILNQSARERVFKKAMEKNIAIQIMFAVRLALSRPNRLVETVKMLLDLGEIDGDIDKEDPLGFLIHEDGAKSVVDAAYRFCLGEPGVHVVLSGTGNIEHLKANLETFSRPPLPAEDVERLKQLFKNVDFISGQ